MSGDTVRVAPGTYVENLAWPVGNVELLGTSGAAVTIVDGNDAGSVVVIPVGATATIDGVTLRNGTASTGAGIHNKGTLTLRNSTVTGNLCLDGYGGAGIRSQGSLTLINSTVSGNSCSGGYYGGGGIRSDASTTLIDSTISGNTTNATPGGGLFAASGSVQLINTRIENNVTGAGFFLSGAGLYVRDAASLSLTNSTVSGNLIAGVFGGLSGVGAGVFVSRTPFTASASTFAGNSASYRAGGIFAYQCNPTQLRNCTISDNSGTGLVTVGAANSAITVLNCTIAGNASSYDCGGFSHTSPGVAQVRNSIIAGNSGNFGASPDLDGAFQSLGHNLIGSSLGGTGFTNGVLGDQVGVANPGLAPLANNGGPTLTRALLPGSPAINAGDPLVFELFDQRGVPRSAGSADVGAFESQVTATYCTAGTSSNGCVALISSSGTASASAASGFTISVASVPGQRQGLILYGVDNMGFTPTVWGSGSSFLCVKSPLQRTTAQFSGGTANQCDGALSIDWNTFRASNPTVLGAPFAAGDAVYAQGWYRDPPASKSTSLSNALQFFVGP